MRSIHCTSRTQQENSNNYKKKSFTGQNKSVNTKLKNPNSESKGDLIKDMIKFNRETL